MQSLEWLHKVTIFRELKTALHAPRRKNKHRAHMCFVFLAFDRRRTRPNFVQIGCLCGIVKKNPDFTTDFNSVTSYWGTFCGQVQPPVIYSTRNELQIFFTSNYTSNEADRNAHQRQMIDSLGFFAIFGVTPQGNYFSGA